MRGWFSWFSWFHMCDRVDQLPIFPQKKGMGNSTQVRIGVYRAPWNKDSVIKGGMSLSPERLLTMAHIGPSLGYITSNDYHPYQGSLNYRTHIGGIKQYESIVILRDFPYNGALYIRKSSTAVFLGFFGNYFFLVQKYGGSSTIMAMAKFVKNTLAGPICTKSFLVETWLWNAPIEIKRLTFLIDSFQLVNPNPFLKRESNGGTYMPES